MNPKTIGSIGYDVVIVASALGLNIIVEQLLNMGVDRHKIITEYVSVQVKSKIVFLEKLGELFDESRIDGHVAEAGVFQGEFAKEINRVFPTRKLYLFDTFSGFDARDVLFDQENHYSSFQVEQLNFTSEELVVQKLPHPNRCIIRKGHFPETAEGLDETFCFVHIDFDLYLPMLAGLEYFIPRMVKGGVILVHDYFNDGVKGAKEAVRDYFSKREKLPFLPIGDGMSIGISC